MPGTFDALMARRGEIMKRALGMDYSMFERSPIGTVPDQVTLEGNARA